MKKEPMQNLTKKDMNIKQKNDSICPILKSVISDGEINQKNLEKLNLNKQWIEQQLKQSGIDTISDVFYAEVQTDRTLFIDPK